MPKVFISHSWNDNDVSKKIAEFLKNDGGEIWIDYAKIDGGDSLPERIGKALEWCNALVLIWSSSAFKSPWVKEEWENALSMGKRIIPCLLDNTERPPILRNRLYIDFRDFDDGYKKLSETLKLSTKVGRTYSGESVKIEIEKPRSKEWMNDREILQNMKQPLKEFNQMNRFPDNYRAPKCLELASLIEREAEKIQCPEFLEIKAKLLEYARRKEQINQNTGLKTLMNLFQKRVEPNKFEPLVLCEEIDKVLKVTSVSAE